MAKACTSVESIHDGIEVFPGAFLKYFNPAFVSPKLPFTREELIAQWIQVEKGKSNDEFVYRGLLSAPAGEYYRLGFGAVSLRNNPSAAQLRSYEHNCIHNFSLEGDPTNVHSFAVPVEIESTDLFINEAFNHYNLWLDSNQMVIVEDVIRQFESEAVFPIMEGRLNGIFGQAKYDETAKYPFLTNYPQIDSLFVCTKRS